MKPFLRQYQALNLWNNFDQWFHEKINKPTLNLTVLATGNIVIKHNSRAVFSGSSIDVEIEHCHTNVIEVDLCGHQLLQFYIEGFDMSMVINIEEKFTFEFNRPFIEWFNQQCGTTETSAYTLADNTKDTNTKISELEKRLLEDLSKLKF